MFLSEKTFPSLFFSLEIALRNYQEEQIIAVHILTQSI